MFNPLSWRWQDEYLILPWVRSLFARVAGVTAWLALGMALGAAAEFLLLSQGVPFGVLFGFVSQLCSAFLTVGAGVLLPWCCVVMLAGRGSLPGRYALCLCAFFSGVHALCVVYELVTDTCLLAQQSQLPLLLPLVWFFIFVLHWGHMAVLPLRMRCRLVAFFLLYLAAVVTDVPAAPDVLLLCVLCKAAAAWAVFSPLRRLACFAPRVVGLPPLPVKE